MKNVDAKMLGDFTVVVDGNNIVEKIRYSKRSMELLQYFIINKDKSISTGELFNVLWPDDENTNPESTLRTRISRFRSDLASCGLKNAIATVSGFYRWSEDIKLNVDVFELERLSSLGKAEEALEQASPLYENMLSLYGGDLLRDYAMSSWIAPKSMYYHNLFITSIHRYVKMLEKEMLYEQVSAVARRALDIDQFDSSLNLSLMDALLKTGKTQEAFERYNYTTGIHYSRLGINPSKEIVEFYKSLIISEQASSGDIETICEELKNEANRADGAFFCEYAIFKDVFRIYSSNFNRLNIPLFAAMISLRNMDSNKPEDFLMLDKNMLAFKEILKDKLRIGDTVSRYSPSQFVLLLPAITWQTGQSILQRLKDTFYQEYPSSRYIVHFKLKPISFV